MFNIAKTVVAIGASSGLGFEVVKQLLAQSQPYNFILGARNTETTKAAFNDLKYDSGKHNMTILPLDLSDLKGSVKPFAQQTLEKLGSTKIDYLMLNAGMSRGSTGPGPHGSKWCDSYVVNSLSQHYLTSLFEQKLVESKSRIVVVSSGAIRNADDAANLEKNVLANGESEHFRVYCDTKFIQLLTAQWWRRHLPAGTATLVACSPGMIPGTGLGRRSGFALDTKDPDAKTIPEGAQSILRAFFVDDLPADPQQLFLTSWGEFWPKDVYAKALDEKLQDQWSPSQAEIEKEAGMTA